MEHIEGREGDGGPPLLLDVSVQTSRFDEAATTSVNLKGITVVVGGQPDVDSEDDTDDSRFTARRELIADAELSLATGAKYALIGRNGTEKSIFLKVLASGTLFDPDTQLRLRIQLVAQSFAPPPTPEWTVSDEINTVLKDSNHHLSRSFAATRPRRAAVPTAATQYRQHSCSCRYRGLATCT